MKRTLALAAALFASAAASAADRYLPGGNDDPNLRAAQYQNDENRYFSALTELLAVPRSNDKAADRYQWLLAENYLSFGMGQRAEPIYRELAISATDHLLLGQARLRLARFDYERGYYEQARSALLKMQEHLPKPLVDEWQDLSARVLMAQGRYNEAVAVLTSTDNASQQSPYTRYNLGVALINDGRVPQGRDVLDRIGRMRVETLDDLALRDKANLTLGWHFLHNQLGGSAKPIFGRVRSQGPYSNRALLGLGWAELSPQGTKQARATLADEELQGSPFTTFSTLGVLLRPGFLDRDIFKRAGMRDFKLDKLAKGEQDALKRALAAWVELINRDPMDPAVQEGWLAIPYSLDKLGAHAQALQFYEKAVDNLENNRKRADAAMTSIREGRMVETIVRRDIDAESGWEWKLKDLPDAPETYYLQNLLAEHRFQEALKNYRDVRMMQRNLDSWKARLDTMETAYKQPRPDVAPEILFRRATEDWTPSWTEPAMTLRADTALAAPGSYDAKAAPASPPAIELATGMPKRFDGDWEKIQSLKARQASLHALLETAANDQGKVLQTMAINELTGQKKQIEKYLVEARFALARLYDRQLKGELDDQH